MSRIVKNIRSVAYNGSDFADGNREVTLQPGWAVTLSDAKADQLERDFPDWFEFDLDLDEKAFYNPGPSDPDAAEHATPENERDAADENEDEEARVAEAQRVEAERVEAERLEAERLEAERLEAERVEAERVEAERLEAERVEAERVEAERLAEKEAADAEEQRIASRTVAQILEEVGSDSEKAKAELKREKKSSSPRSTLVAELEKRANPPAG